GPLTLNLSPPGNPSVAPPPSSGAPGGGTGPLESHSGSTGAKKKPPKPEKPEKPAKPAVPGTVPPNTQTMPSQTMPSQTLASPQPSWVPQSSSAQSVSATQLAAGPVPPPQPPARISQTARFIAADPSALRVQLGADGKLPELLLEDADKQQETVAEEKPQSSPPWLLMGVFAISIAMSLAMLFMEVDGGGAVGQRSQVLARTQLKQLYTGDYPPLAPYQQRVRQALQAFQRGDRDEERRLLREVLDILHAESKSRTTGITGMIDAPDPPIGNPSDRHLESLISTLLAD
ncbi:MAG: hypothetical protein ACKO38_09500, partial [Planctomycetota bacterium]